MVHDPYVKQKNQKLVVLDNKTWLKYNKYLRTSVLQAHLSSKFGSQAPNHFNEAWALDWLHGATPLWSLVAMVACGNQCKPFSIVTPTRANSEGKLQG